MYLFSFAKMYVKDTHTRDIPHDIHQRTLNELFSSNSIVGAFCDEAKHVHKRIGYKTVDIYIYVCIAVTITIVRK